MTIACIESFPVTLFWTWLDVSIGVLIGAWWAGGRGARDDE